MGSKRDPRQLFIPCGTRSLNWKHKPTSIHTVWWSWIQCQCTLKLLGVDVQNTSAPPSLNGGNAPGHYGLWSYSKNTTTAITQKTPPTLGCWPTAEGSDVMMTTQKGSLEVDVAAVQPPPPPTSTLPSESRVVEL